MWQGEATWQLPKRNSPARSPLPQSSLGARMVLSAQTTDLAQQHIHDLQSPDVETQRRASKAIRDSVIGNWPKKRLYIGLNLVPRTLELLQNAATDEQVTIQLITALGSCTYQAEAGRSLSDANVWATLARYIHHPNLKVVEASVCALKLMLANTAAPERPTLSDADVRRIVALIGPQPAACPSSMHEHCALLLATYCAAPANQRTVAGQKDAIRHLADLVLSNVPIVQEAALKCLAALVHKQPPIAAQVGSTPMGPDPPASPASGGGWGVATGIFRCGVFRVLNACEISHTIFRATLCEINSCRNLPESLVAQLPLPHAPHL